MDYFTSTSGLLNAANNVLDRFMRAELGPIKSEKIMNLEILSSRRVAATIDVLFVGGRSPGGYIDPVSNGARQFWPREFLCHDMPEARIIIAESHRGMTEQLHSMFNLSERTTIGSAEGLASELLALRSNTASSRRPIILVGFGKAGMACKILFTNTNLRACIIGVMFIACPLTDSWSYFGQQYPFYSLEPPKEKECQKIDKLFEDAASQEHSRSIRKQIVSITRREDFVSLKAEDLDSELFRRRITEERITDYSMADIIDTTTLVSRHQDEYRQILTIFESWLMESQEASSVDIKKMPSLAWAAYSKANDLQSPNIKLAPQLATLSALLTNSQTYYSHRFMPGHIMTLANETCKTIMTFLNRANAENLSETEVDQILKDVKEMNAQMLCGREIPRREDQTALRVGGEFSPQHDGAAASAPFALRPLESSNTLRPFIKSVKLAVEEILNQRKVRWSFINVCYLLTAGDCKPTIVVSVFKSAESDWESLQEELLQGAYSIIPTFLHHEFGGIQIINGQSTPHSPFIGGPIGINSTRATLGGYISLQKVQSDGLLGDFESGKFILTNHHVVKPVARLQAPGSTLTMPYKDWRRAVQVNDPERSKPIATILAPCGCTVAPNTSLCPYEMEYERLCGKRRTLVDCGAPTEEIDRLIPQYQRFGQQCRNSTRQVIGRVWATSGLRVSPTNHRLDWAIIKVDGDGEHENLVPPSSSVIPYRAPLSALPQTVDNAKRIKLARVEGTLQTIAKLGYRSASYGIMDASELALVVSSDTNERTEELCAFSSGLNFWPHGHRISMEGDSGSWILNSEGNLIGLLWGGIEEVDVAFITPIDEVIADIKRQTQHVVRLSGGVDILSRDPTTAAYH